MVRYRNNHTIGTLNPYWYEVPSLIPVPMQSSKFKIGKAFRIKIRPEPKILNSGYLYLDLNFQIVFRSQFSNII
jgi:hypothetical protein